jgi:lipopolysaccharide heptosyltransferase II
VAGLTLLGGRRAPGPLDPTRVRRILVVRLDLLGDLVLSMPAVQALRTAYPEARIDLLTSPYAAPVAALFPAIDAVIALDVHQFRPSGAFWRPRHYLDLLRVVRRLRGARYDLAVSLHGGHASLFAYLAGATQRAGFAGEAYAGTLTIAAPGRRYFARKHEVEYGLALAAAAGAGAGAHEYGAEAPEAAIGRLAERLRAAGIGDAERVVVIHPGASNGAAKRWRTAGWAEVADRLAAAGLCVVFTGSVGERPVVAQVRADCRRAHLSLAGETALPELAALLRRACVFAGGDTGPMHLAVALGTPVVAVHGPTDPAFSGPYAGPATVIRHDLPCSPCYDATAPAECWRGDTLCMQLVTADEVFGAVMAYADGGRWTVDGGHRPPSTVHRPRRP